MFLTLTRWIGTGAKAIGLQLLVKMTELLKGGLYNSRSMDQANVLLVMAHINAEPAMAKVLYTQEVKLGTTSVALNVVVPAFARHAMFPEEVVDMEAVRQV